jgi:tetratricopeptide (TPR) repeat protein
MKLVTPKAFLEAISKFAMNPKKVKDYFNDKRITNNEKKLLKALFLLRDNLPERVISLLDDSNDEGLVEVNAFKYYLLGLSYCSISSFEKGIYHLHKALNLLSQNDHPVLYFSFLHNLVICYLNMNNSEEAQKHLEKAKDLNIFNSLNILQKNSLNLLEFRLNNLKNNLHKAESIYNDIYKNIKSLSDAQKGILYVESFKMFVCLENKEMIYKMLKEMLKIRKYIHTANYNFMKILSDFVFYNKPIYIKDRMIFVKIPLLMNQLECIQNLESQDIEKATLYWEKLKQFDSRIYHDNFNYQGPKSIFSLALNKVSFDLDRTIKPPEDLSKAEKLIWILEKSQAPVSKAEIYKLIWGKNLNNKEDLQKLGQLVFYIKSHFSVEIQSRKGCYVLSMKQVKRTS